MEDLEELVRHLREEIDNLREKNNELVQERQFWKVTAADKEKEKLELMRELNEARLKLSRLRSGGAAEARKLETGIQTASEAALSHLIQASGAIVKGIELAKQYMRDREELENLSPRWSSVGGTPSTEKVHRCRPTMMGGQSIQPVVSLTRTMLNLSARSNTRSPSQNQTQSANLTDRAFPMHMLQDVYIPLTRIDMSDLQGNNMETEENDENSVDDLGLDDSESAIDESHNLSGANDFETSGKLDAVIEESEEEEADTPPRSLIENPLEGPSWLLDVPSRHHARPRTRVVLEPDSTTPCDPSAVHGTDDAEEENEPLAFTPTVRRRKRASTPPSCTPRANHYSPRPLAATSNNFRVLKVVVAKMRLSDDDPGGAGDSSPPKRATLATSPITSNFDATQDDLTRTSDILPLRTRDASSPRQDASQTKWDDPPPRQDASQTKQDASTPRQEQDASPPRKDASRRKQDTLPPRKDALRRKHVDSPPKQEQDASPPKKDASRRKQDTSPPRKDAWRRKQDTSPPRKDASRRKQDASPPRQDASRRKQSVSPSRIQSDLPRRVESASPPRQGIEFSSPPRRQSASPPKRSATGDVSPPKRPMRFDAPSPNGSTDAGVIVVTKDDKGVDAAWSRAGGSGEPSNVTLRRARRRADRESRRSVDTSGSEGSAGSAGSAGELVTEGRARRARIRVTYKEKPLNRKLRR